MRDISVQQKTGHAFTKTYLDSQVDLVLCHIEEGALCVRVLVPLICQDGAALQCNRLACVQDNAAC